MFTCGRRPDHRSASSGTPLSLVPACCNIAGLDTPHKRFLNAYDRRSLFAGCSLIMQLLLAQTIPLPLILTGLTLILGVTAELGPCMRDYYLPRLSRQFSLSLAGNMPVWEPLLIYALGTLWYGLFNWFWFWMWREQPLRESLSLLYRELADYCEAKYSMLTQHADPIAAPCWCASKKRWIDYPVLSANAYAVGASQQRLQAPAACFQEALDLQEHISVSLHQPEEVQKLVERSHAEQVIRWNARTVAERLRVLADDILYHRYRPVSRWKTDWHAGENRQPASGQSGGSILLLALQPYCPGAAYPAPAVCP
jgi:uncharacterized membrane protein YccC